MTRMIQENVFDKFFTNRDSLIYQFRKGDITKKEFIEEHYAFITRLNLRPFKNRIDSYEKGIYNYQYYNMLAKYTYMKANDIKIKNKHPELINKLKNDAKNYYYQKDKTILKLLNYLEYKNVYAYFIKTKSTFLKDKLFEIVLEDYDNVVLHSINQMVLNKLREEYVFIEETKKSIIDKYVNEKY